MDAVRCAACGSSQPPQARVCSVCSQPLGVARTVDDVEPVPSRSRTVPEAPLSGAMVPQHLAPQPKPAPGPAAAAPSYLAAGTVIDGKYAIVRLLGQGGMGVVYLARDVHTGMDVVLKSVRAELAHRPDVRARTLAEGRVLGQIDHPNVVHLKAVVVDDKGLWLVMQYIEGESLDRTIDRANAEKKPTPIAEALRLFRQIASGIAAAHAEGIIHRDLKPANVLIRRKDHVAKVTDFGIAKAEHGESLGRVQTRGVIGSVWYMSPEQVTGRRDLDKRVDVYALGIVLYQMLTGHVPFDAESDYEVMRKQAEEPLPRAAASRADVPAALDDLLQKLCAKNRDDRFQSCDEVLSALSLVEAELGVGQGPSPTAAPARTALPAPSVPPPADGARLPEADRPTPLERKASPASADAAPPSAATTTPDAGAATTTPKGRRLAPWIALGLALAAAGSVATLVVAGALPHPSKWLGGGAKPKPVASAPSASTPPPPSPASAPPASSAKVDVSPVEQLVGDWVGGGDRALIAVEVAGAVEFRVKDPAQFAPADYEVGEARFVLRPVQGQQAVFNVEDRLRPNPPIDFPFDRARARSTCQDVRSEASGAPLRATLDGGRLSVELMKIEPTRSNFVLEKGVTVSCRGLAKLEASKVVSVLTRK